MNQVDLIVQHRETGKGNSKKLRRQGIVPGIYYTNGKPGIPFAAKAISMRSIIYTSETKLVSLQFEGEKEQLKCFLKKITFDPVTDKPVHVDFLGIEENKKMSVEVPLILVGAAEGVKMGGILSQVLHRVEIECLPVNVPNFIEVDITNLSIGKTIHLRDVKHENIAFKHGEDSLVVQISAPRVSADAAAGKK
jgi:large subunit ribosomal protein L25